VPAAPVAEVAGVAAARGDAAADPAADVIRTGLGAVPAFDVD
jgi:hypothetical protein